MGTQSLHGRSLLPLAEGRIEWPRAVHFGEYHGDWYGHYSARMVTDGQWKLVWNLSDLCELYDLENDPGELTNLFYDARHREVRDRYLWPPGPGSQTIGRWTPTTAIAPHRGSVGRVPGRSNQPYLTEKGPKGISSRTYIVLQQRSTQMLPHRSLAAQIKSTRKKKRCLSVAHSVRISCSFCVTSCDSTGSSAMEVQSRARHTSMLWRLTRSSLIEPIHRQHCALLRAQAC